MNPSQVVPPVPCVPGAPSWVSLMTPDIGAARSFYGPLLGWDFRPAPESSGPYCHAVRKGARVAGIGHLPPGWSQQAAWMVFFGVADISLAAERVTERAGTVGVGPVDCAAGRMALATDPQGLQFGLWQGASGPARHLRLPGAPNWVELSSPDAFEAALFYGAVLDWDQQESEHLDVWWEHERVVVRVQGYNVAALRTQDTSGPATGWHVSFEVADVELAGAEALRLGGEVVSPPTGTPYGPTALLRDPGGAHFTVIAPSGSGAGHMNPRFAGAAGHGTTVLTGRGPGS